MVNNRDGKGNISIPFAEIRVPSYPSCMYPNDLQFGPHIHIHTHIHVHIPHSVRQMVRLFCLRRKLKKGKYLKFPLLYPLQKFVFFSCSFVRNLNIYTDDVFRYDIPAFMAVRLFLFSLSHTLSALSRYMP